MANLTDSSVPMDELPLKDYIEVRNREEREPFAPKNSAGAEEEVEPKTEGDEQERPEEAEASNEPPQQKRGRGGFQKRISRLTARNYELQEKLRRYEGNGNTQQATPSAQVEEPAHSAVNQHRLSNAPEVAEFLASNPELVRALEREPAQAVERVHQMSRDLVLDSHKARMREELAPLSDAERQRLSDGAASAPPLAPWIGDAILAQPNSHKVTRHLAENPEIVEKLNQIPPVAAISEIGRISGRLDSDTSSSPDKTRKEPPPPIRPIGASSTRSSVSMDKIPIKDFITIRNRQEREAKRWR